MANITSCLKNSKVTNNMLTGLNHLTLAVTDLNPSVAFYQDLLQLRLEASWDTGAYLSLPGLWLCLSVDPLRSSKPAADYTHYAFTVSAADSPCSSNAFNRPTCRNGATTVAKAHPSISSTRTATSSKPTSVT